MAETGLFKNWFDERAARSLGEQVAAVHGEFDADQFVSQAMEGLEALELKARVRQFAAALRSGLPADVPQAFAILGRSLPKAPTGPAEDVTASTDQWPINDFIGEYGFEANGTVHLQLALDLMTDVTQRFSSEFAVRPYIVHDQDAVMERLYALLDHPSEHVRRWCSEGTRPRLPWGLRLHSLVADPSPAMPILEALKDDPSEYVRRSVANHLNDIAKDHPELVVETADRWLKKASKDRMRLVKHALRSLLKAADPGALNAMGYAPPKGLSAQLQVTPHAIAIGDSVRLVLDVQSSSRADLLIDFRVHYIKSNGSSSAKVFKWTTRKMAVGESIRLEKKLTLVPRSIRKLYPGRHIVDVQVNGAIVAESAFELGYPG